MLHVEYHTLWEGELGHSWAAIAEPGEFTDVLTGYDDACVQGFGDGPHHAGRRATVQADVRRRYEAQVTELLDD